MDSNLVREAVELLATLDQEQRNDLSVHLYSAHTLKTLLYKANKDENRILQTEMFIKTVLRDDWTAWPNENTILNPNTSDIYEDQLASVSEYRPTSESGQTNEDSLDHATEMLYGEMNAFWQQKLKESFQRGSMNVTASEDEQQNEESSDVDAIDREDNFGGKTLDVNGMDLPAEIFQNILFKMDEFMGSLHLEAAQTNGVTLSTVPSEPGIKVSGKDLGSVEPNCLRSKSKFDYKDIIVHACQSGENMSEEYIKAIDLFQDVPQTLDTSQFELPEEYLQKFSQLDLKESDLTAQVESNELHVGSYKNNEVTESNIQNKTTSSSSKDKTSNHDTYVSLKRIISDRRYDRKLRREARLLLYKSEFSRDKKMFYTVLNQQKTISKKSGDSLNKEKERYENTIDVESDYGFEDLL